VTPFRLHGPLLSPVSEIEFRFFLRGVVAVGGDGRIAYSGPEPDLPEYAAALPRRESPGLLLPGFIDLHTHLPQYNARGRCGASLLEWLDRHIYPEEIRFADASYAREVSKHFFRALAASGTTTAAVYCSAHAEAARTAFEEAERSRLRIILGRTLMDRNAPPELVETPATSLREDEELISHWHRRTERLWCAVTPRFAPSCSMELMRGAARLAERHGCYVQTHVNESPAEIARARELFPELGSYTEVYETAGLLGERTLLAHNIHATESELDLCERTACAVVHCPEANLFLGSGRFPLKKYRNRTIRYGLGSDVGAGTTLFMPQIMRSMAWVQQENLHPFIPLYRATAGAAEALSLERNIGALDTGLCADMIAMRCDLETGEDAELSAEDAASAVVYRSQPSDILAVWVAGEQVFSSA